MTWSAAAAAPVEPPGELLGVELGTPLKPGFYLLDTAGYGGVRDGSRDGFDIPILVYVARDVAERSPAGPDTRGWLRLTIPLTPGAASALPSRLVER